MRTWQCTICKYIHHGDEPPEKCPICKADASKFIEIFEEGASPETPPVKKTESVATGPSSPDTQGTQDNEDASPSTPPKQPAQKILSPAETVGGLKGFLIRHHAHPICVHTPNGVLPLVMILWVLAWQFPDYEFFKPAAIINQIFVLLSLPVVIYTGIVEWGVKYLKASTWMFRLKIFSAVLTSGLCIATLVWYFLDKEILTKPNAWIFIALNVAMVLCAGIAGHIGGKLVFKD